MCHGLVVIAGESSGGCPFVLGETGILTDVSETNAIYKELMRICSNRKHALDLSHKTQRRAYNEFSIAHIYNQYEALYSEVAQEAV
jgi:glycosyltransferase involved in cell wall biosynthesis